MDILFKITFVEIFLIVLLLVTSPLITTGKGVTRLIVAVCALFGAAITTVAAGFLLL